MRTYVRARVPGASYFFTLTLRDRRSALLVEYIDALRNAFKMIKRARPFVMDAVVVMPDHLHCVWTLPDEDTDYSTRWRLIKSGFARTIPPGDPVCPSRARRREREIWQRRYWEHVIRDERDFDNHLDYIHYNPVKHGHADSCGAWPFSSFRKFVAAGVYSDDWAASPEVSRFDWD